MSNRPSTPPESPAKYGPLTLSTERTGDGYFIIEAQSNMEHKVKLTEIWYKPHAAYIIRAVNCHDELVEALEKLTTACERATSEELGDLDEIDGSYIDAANAALAAAKAGAA